MRFLASVIALAALATPAQAQREPVLRQIDLPHNYYYREMYLPQLTTGPSSVAWWPDSKSVVYSMGGTLWRQEVESGDAADGTTKGAASGAPTSVAEQLTDGPGYHYQPEVSPDGEWIVFTAYDNDALELRALHVASRRVAQLTSGSAVNLDARFSPDGKRVVFVSTQYNRRFHIFLADFAGGTLANVRRLTGETRSELPRYYYSAFDHEIGPAWSPDGREIIFVSNRGHLYGTGGIWRMAAKPGADAREVHREETTWKARPDWSRDGKNIVFSSYLGRQWHQLWAVPAEAGGYAFPLTYGEYDNTAARYSPDGKRIAFISNRDGNTSLWMQDVLGGAQRELRASEKRYRRPHRRVRIRVLDPQGRPAAARVSVIGADGRSYAPDDAWMHADEMFVRGPDASGRGERPFEAHYFHTRGTAQLNLPEGKFEIEVMKGFEHRIEQRSLELSAAGPATALNVTVRLQPLAFAALRSGARQWVSGDAHVHMNYGGAYRNTPENLVRQAEAEGLRVVHNLIVNKEQRIPDVEYFRGERIDPASTVRTQVLHSQEYHTSAWGHLSFLGLRENLVIPDYADYPLTAAASLFPSNDVVADLARAQGALVGYVHPFDVAPDPVKDARLSYALPADVAHGKVDYLEVMGFSDHLITSEVWYRLLNLGFRIPAAAGTDAMSNFASLRGPLGLVRTYVRVPANRLNMREWLDGLRAGRTFVTNGPLLHFRLGGKEVGDELTLAAGGKAVAFAAALRSIVPLDHAQIVCNGEVVHELELAGDRMSVDAAGEIALGRSGWCVLRAYAEKATHPILDLYPFASTSPVYVTVDGQPARSAEDAAFFVKWMDRVLEFTRSRTSWNTPQEQAAVIAYIEQAKALFQIRAEK